MCSKIKQFNTRVDKTESKINKMKVYMKKLPTRYDDLFNRAVG